MNNSISEGNWKEFKGKVRQNWGKVTDDELEQTKGNVDEIVGKIQAKYGEAKDSARAEINKKLESIKQSLS